MRVNITSWDDYLDWLKGNTESDKKKSKDLVKVLWGLQTEETPKVNPYQATTPKVDYEVYNKRNQGIKESEGKLFYELDWNFITQMAERIDSNDKYPRYNWKKQMDVEELKQALFRHVIAVMKGEYEDDGRELGHLEAIATNVMLINYQLKNFK